MSDSSLLWYANRATGAVSLVLFTVVVLLGIAVRLRGRLPGLPRFGTVQLHRALSLSAIVFLALHITAAVVDSYVGISLLDVLVPFASTYQPLWLGLGTVALDLMLAVLITSCSAPASGTAPGAPSTGWPGPPGRSRSSTASASARTPAPAGCCG
ncbi:ferric reductase-like transmembrane domain-containing protein [Streptomyces mirabilis]|uniref:ferric reductase-like transmembrane domain-containing protein n=1 Tax=Streptomyces mirabilis TaxID=68239 RepID=UPI0036599D39